MSRPVLSAPARLARKPLSAPSWPSPARRFTTSCQPCRLLRSSVSPSSGTARRLFSASTTTHFRVAPPVRSAEPPQPSPPSNPLHIEAAPLTESQYHELADDYLDRLLVRLEDLQDAREDVDVEFSAGVLTLALTAADGTTRTYVVNKQPPNKQIWLSSPTSGPKRYDWVAAASHPDGGAWIYLKDGSSLNSLVREEIGIDLDAADDGL